MTRKMRGGGVCNGRGRRSIGKDPLQEKREKKTNVVRKVFSDSLGQKGVGFIKLGRGATDVQLKTEPDEESFDAKKLVRRLGLSAEAA